MEAPPRVLVVDDDEDVRAGVTWALEADGFVVHAVSDGLQAMEALDGLPPALVVLDLTLPGLGGLDVLKQLRAAEAEEQRTRLPIIVLSGRDGETDRIVGLDMGADDYLVKPFSPGELAARARSLLRRSTDYRSTTTSRFQPTGEGVEIDSVAREVWVDGTLVEFPAMEFDLLQYFVNHPRRACTRDELINAVWASQASWQTPATVTEHVYRVRQKIEEDPKRPRYLATVRGVGYRWEG